MRFADKCRKIGGKMDYVVFISCEVDLGEGRKLNISDRFIQYTDKHKNSVILDKNEFYKAKEVLSKAEAEGLLYTGKER